MRFPFLNCQPEVVWSSESWAERQGSHQLRERSVVRLPFSSSAFVHFRGLRGGVAVEMGRMSELLG